MKSMNMPESAKMSERAITPLGRLDIMQHEQLQPSAVKTTQILGFFVPLGLAASLITLSHVIINSVLSRAPAPELTIAA